MAIILKEAFRHQNFLDRLMSSAEYYLRDNRNVMVSTEKHLRSKVQPTVEDVVKDSKTERELPISPNVVILFMKQVLVEKEKLSIAINNAKTQHCPDLDMSIAINKSRQRVVSSLKRLAAMRNKKTTTKGSDYCFNNEGNQVQYIYDVEVISEIDFDMANVKKTISSLSADSDATSRSIDYWLSSVPVNYEPFYDINSSFEELVVEFENMDMAS